jgi:hypothetical protein
MGATASSRRSLRVAAPAVVLLLLLLSRGLRAQLSQPLAHDSQVDEQANKFLQRDVSHSTDGGK